MRMLSEYAVSVAYLQHNVNVVVNVR